MSDQVSEPVSGLAANQRRLCAVDDLQPGEARAFEVGKEHIALVRIEERFYAIGDICSHQRISLSEGDVHPDTCELECWKHGSTFSLVTGEPSTLPATKAVAVYPVDLVDDGVVVTIGGHR